MEAIPLPNRAKVEDLGNNKYSLVLEPLYPGYGDTVGNALRRVLLSSMPGAAVTAVKIKFADHEFATVPGVKEDVIQIILNLKQLRVRSHSAEPVRLFLKTKGEKVVTAADIQETDQVQIVNKDLFIATLDSKSTEFDMELVIEQGRGYWPIEARDNHKPEIGMIPIDAIFTPVRSVFYNVSNVRVGQLTNFNKLELVMETDGTINGSEAYDIASHILVDHFTMAFTGGSNMISAAVPEIEAVPEVEMPAMETSSSGENEIEATHLSTRAKNALTKNGIISLVALQGLSSEQIANMDGLGEKTIKEIIDFLGR